jgi:hypothetical protein
MAATRPIGNPERRQSRLGWLPGQILNPDRNLEGCQEGQDGLSGFRVIGSFIEIFVTPGRGSCATFSLRIPELVLS